MARIHCRRRVTETCAVQLPPLSRLVSIFFFFFFFCLAFQSTSSSLGAATFPSLLGGPGEGGKGGFVDANSRELSTAMVFFFLYLFLPLSS